MIQICDTFKLYLTWQRFLARKTIPQTSGSGETCPHHPIHLNPYFFFTVNWIISLVDIMLIVWNYLISALWAFAIDSLSWASVVCLSYPYIKHLRISPTVKEVTKWNSGLCSCLPGGDSANGSWETAPSATRRETAGSDFCSCFWAFLWTQPSALQPLHWG